MVPKLFLYGAALFNCFLAHPILMLHVIAILWQTEALLFRGTQGHYCVAAHVFRTHKSLELLKIKSEKL